MIAYIKGELADIDESRIVVECGNIGYNIFVPANITDQLGRIGTTVKIHTYMNVREDAMQLFGFATKDDLKTFKLLIGVNGIGPKAALGILSVLSADDLRFAVLADDVKKISEAPGIGKKTAQKLILELKDKLDLEESFAKRLEHQQEDPAEPASDARDEAVLALVALGYSRSEAAAAVRKADIAAEAAVEDILKAALVHLSF